LHAIDVQIPSVRDPLPAAVQDRLHLAHSRTSELVARSRGGGDPLVLLHGDIADGNILWCPGPVLIDWEYARIGDAADELGHVFSQGGFNERQRAAFWRGYGDDSVRERVGWWEAVSLLGSTLWWVERWSPGTRDHYLEQALRRLARLEALLTRVS
jgi:thiamine kinase-like enzyme